MVSLEFKGKKIIQNLHLGVEYHQLVPDKKKSLTEKISLEDNLKALKALLPNYANKIKCIYIDPPYNTGNEGWKYNDNVNSPMMQEWLGKEVGTDDLTRHDKWLCMMTPRLKLLRELLSDDGVIFISIDDNEQHRLRGLMDEIFGEENFVSQLVVVNNIAGRSDRAHVASAHEYVLIYQKSEYFSSAGVALTDEQLEEYKYTDKGGKYRLQGLRKRGSSSRRQDRPNMFYPIYYDEKTNSVSLEKKDFKSPVEIIPKLSDGADGRWRWSKETFLDNLDYLEVRRVNSRYDIFEKVHLNVDGTERTTKLKSFLLDSMYTSDIATTAFKEIMPGLAFENPKSIELIKDLISVANTTDGIILDSFAGSGTTAHAVLDLNKEDGGKRKFILVECEDYADSITAERVRRVIKGVKGAKDEKLKEGLGGSFSFFELGDAIDLKGILSGKSLPSYQELARYVYYTATGEEFVEKRVDQKLSYIGESRNFEVYLIYKPDMAFLKTAALNTKFAECLGLFKGKRRLVFAPANFLDASYLAKYSIDFCQLPYEIYRIKG